MIYRSPIIIVALICSLSYAQQESLPSLNSRHASAVDLARAGNFDAALTILEALRIQAPQDRRLLEDQIATLSWSGRDAEAMALAEQLDSSAVPAYTAVAIAKSARNLTRFAEAAAWYDRVPSSEPEYTDAQIGRALALADAGNFAEAHATLDRLIELNGPAVDISRARAYASLQGGTHLGALRAYDEILAEAPSDFESLRGKALTLRDLLLPDQALTLARQHPGILDDEEIARLEADDLAIRLRMAAGTPRPPSREDRQLDRTIAEIEARLASEQDPVARQILNYDRIVALTKRRKSDLAVSAFEALGQADADIPAYVLAAAGEAYVRTQNPRRGVELLARALAEEPNNFSLQVELIYAYLDLDDYPSAVAIARSILASQPMFLEAPNSPIVKGNDARMQAEVISALADASINDLGAAQRRMESLLDAAPNNLDVRHELAGVYRARGWLDRSLYEYAQVLTVADDLLYAKVGNAYTQIEAQRFEDAARSIEQLRSRQPGEPSVQRLAQTWSTHNRSELTVDASSGDSTGSTFGTRHQSLDARWYTRPIRYNYRAFAHIRDDSAEFPEGEVTRERLGAGIEYRAQRWSVAGEVYGDRSTDGQLGISGNFDWRVSDSLNVSGVVALDSAQAQLRAHAVGIEADELGITAKIAPHESLSYRVGWQHLEYSDGNAGTMLFADARHRLSTRPRSRLEIAGEISSASFGMQDVPYFAPRDAVAYQIGGRHEWRIRRRYERSITQTTELFAGRYDQTGFAGGSIWRAIYMLHVDLSRNLAVQAGVRRARSVYDGAPEYDTTMLLSIQARL